MAVNASVSHERSLLTDKRDNICYQTAELLDGVWYSLTYEQKGRSVKLLLSLFTEQRMVIGGVSLKRRSDVKSLRYYSGITDRNRLLSVGVAEFDTSVIKLTLGELHAKEYTCVSEW